MPHLPDLNTTSTSLEASTLLPPLPLPRFIFLSTPGEPRITSAAFTLMLALLDQDPDMSRWDFEDPLRTATMEIFWGGFQPSLDLSDPSTRESNLPFHPSWTIEQWLTNLRHEMEVDMGRDILARIACSRILDDAAAPHTYRYIFPDTNHSSLVAAFASHFSPQECCVLHIGRFEHTTVDYGQGLRHIWLPEPTLEGKMAGLRRELGVSS